ncbi:MAG: winged helix-turn-helix domain-containing protein [Pyrinomonadaceae bacterium]
MGNKSKGLYEFGNFRLDVETDTLWQDDQLISISPKAFDLLKLLVINGGNIVSKEEIFETVWADTFVEDGVLTQNIYTLRNTLGKDEKGNHLIENIKRRGYRISIPVKRLGKTESAPKTSAVSLDQVGPKEEKKRGKGIFPQRRVLLGILLIVALLSVSGLVFYNLSRNRGEARKEPKTTFDNLSFQRLTDKGDVDFLNISPDGDWLAYSNSDGLFLKDLKADSEIKLEVENFRDIGFLQFSRDGNSLFFRSPGASYLPGNIYQTSRLGGAAKMVAENVWSGFSFSPDGRRLAFTRVKPAENRQVLVVRDLEKGNETELAPQTPPFEFYPRNFPAWSFDGRKIASVVITRTEHFARLLVADLETGRDEEVKTLDFQNVEQVVWTSGGKELIASASDGKNFQLWRIAYPDGEASRITNDLNDYLGLSISSDGKKILARQRKYFSNIWVGDGKDIGSFRQLTQGFARNEGLKGLNWIDEGKIVYTANYEKIRDWNLWVIETADNSRRQLTNDSETQNEYPVVSPDMARIYYSSNRVDSANIRSIGVTGEDQTQITFDEKESELFPQISPDGRWLYYIQEKRDSSAVWRRSLADGKAEKITAENELAPINFLSLSPDGKSLAFQNLTKETGTEKSKGFFKVCVISTDDPREKRFFDLPSSEPFAQFSPDSKALEFIRITTGGSEILRQELDSSDQNNLVLSLKNEWIFKHAWTPDGRQMAISRGNLIRDAVLLTGFE